MWLVETTMIMIKKVGLIWIGLIVFPIIAFSEELVSITDCLDECSNSLEGVGNHISNKVGVPAGVISIWSNNHNSIAECLKQRVVNSGGWKSWGADWVGFRKFITKEIQISCIDPMLVNTRYRVSEMWLEKELFSHSDQNILYGLEPESIPIDSYVAQVWIRFTIESK